MTIMLQQRPPKSLLHMACSLALLLCGCGKKAANPPAASGPSNTTSAGSAYTAPTAPTWTPDLSRLQAQMQKTFAAEPEFYSFRDLQAWQQETANLRWEDGTGLPEFADPQAPKGGTFRFFITDFPRTLRTVGPEATGGIRPWLLDYVAPLFLHNHPDLPNALYPGLAKRWALDPATKTVYLELATDLRWSDGFPLTTDDVAFTFYFYRSPDLNEPWYNDFYRKTYDGLIIYDQHRFALRMKELKPDIFSRAGNIAPQPRHFYADFGPGWLEKYNWREPPTAGPYVLLPTGIDKGRSITLTRVENWWGRDRPFYRGRFNPDKIKLTVIREPSKQFESFLRGDLDLFPLNLSEYWYEKLPDDHPQVRAGKIVKTKFFNQVPRPDWGLWINRAKPLLNNRDLREGLHYASNFDLICAQYYRGDAVRLQTRSDGYSWRVHPTIGPRPFDPSKARALFARAGFHKPGPDGILVNAQNQRLSFTITTYLRHLENILSILKEEARKAGLEYQIEILDASTGWKKVQEKQHEIALVALSRSVEMYPRYWEMYHSSNAHLPNTNNMTNTDLPELDRLIEKYDRLESLEDIQTTAAEIEQIIYDDAAWINGWALPFFRVGYWHWVRWPQNFSPLQARDAIEFFLFSLEPKPANP